MCKYNEYIEQIYEEGGSLKKPAPLRGAKQNDMLQTTRRKIWDRTMKWIFSIAPQDMAAWLLLGEARFVRLLDPVLDGEELFADMLCEIRIRRRKAMLHIEFQKRRDSPMAERLWNYNVRATTK